MAIVSIQLEGYTYKLLAEPEICTIPTYTHAETHRLIYKLTIEQTYTRECTHTCTHSRTH